MDRLLEVVADYRWLLLIPAAAPILWFLLWPLHAHRTQTYSARPQFVRVQLRAQKIPATVRAFFDDVAVDLEPFGFAVVCSLFMGRQLASVKAFVLLLENQAAKDLALALAAFDTAGDQSNPHAQYVEFLSQFENGVEHRTSNSRDLPVFAPVPQRTVVKLPTVDGAADLYQIHQRLLGPIAARLDRIMPDLTDPAAFLTQSIVHELRAQVATGYLYLDRDADAYRPTWKGAFQLTWELFWPVRRLRRAARDRRAKQLLSELELAQPSRRLR